MLYIITNKLSRFKKINRNSKRCLNKAYHTAKVLLAFAEEDYKLAFEMEKLKNEMKDKILNKENTKAVIKHQLKYEYEKQLKKKDFEIKEKKLNNQHRQEQIDILFAKNKHLMVKVEVFTEQLDERNVLIR